MQSPIGKYRPFPMIEMVSRKWPSRTLTTSPRWCSVDLRDGNQALAQPMNIAQKLEMFHMLVACGFKEIEVGFPSASNTEFAFVRRLIEDGHIPDDVTIQVLVQAREDLIERTVESLRGARRVIVHLYNSTSPAQRRVVFGLGKADIIKIAEQGTRLVKEKVTHLVGTEVIFQYSPESFSATEVEFSLQICEAVMDVWEPTPECPMILNLPETVEVAMPNVYADQVEWFCSNLMRRNCAIVSLHTHNDRGTGVAATELGLLAGADRVEGTLFGNGERTGNLDIVTVALNLHMHGIPCGLELGDRNQIKEVYERCTGMQVPPRHPYAGELIFTAFSGSHQDAIMKGFAERNANNQGYWDVPYLAIDPHDIGRRYDEVIRVNSQSGKGGMAYMLESTFGIDLPKEMQREFGPIVNEVVDTFGREVSASEIKELFWNEYILQEAPMELMSFHAQNTEHGSRCQAVVHIGERRYEIVGDGNGPIAAFVHALKTAGIFAGEVRDYREQALGSGEEAQALAYVCLATPEGVRWGAGIDTNIERASIQAIVSAYNRL